MLKQDRPTRLLAIAGFAAALFACHTAPARKGPVIAVAPSCTDFTVSIYFDARSATLTGEARALVKASARRVQGCRVTGVNVLGLADAPGDPDVNLSLSKRRAEAVTKVLAAYGLTTVAFQVRAAGDVGAQTRTGEERPLRRRADVEFHLMSLGAPAVR
ncbi:MAG TPA: OmpA family protein [Caulobacteraceae bacterium]